MTTTTAPRITTRVDPDTQKLLTQAAAVTGISSINSFVLNAAIEKANKIMEHERSLKLSQQDAVMLIDALDSSVKSIPRLRQAAKKYDKKSQS